MKLKFKGIVKTGDACRVSDDDIDGSIFIGETDLVEVMSEHKGKFTFAIADKTFSGELFVSTGWGYSEWTPMESDELKVGDNDLIEILSRYEGQEITLFAFDEGGANILSETEWKEYK